VPNLAILKEYTPLLSQFWSHDLFQDMDARYFHLINRSHEIEHLLHNDMKSSFDHALLFSDFQSIFNHPDTESYINKMTHFIIH
jgi:asparagine synthase (glutamine-hydrolysing)